MPHQEEQDTKNEGNHPAMPTVEKMEVMGVDDGSPEARLFSFEDLDEIEDEFSGPVSVITRKTFADESFKLEKALGCSHMICPGSMDTLLCPMPCPESRLYPKRRTIRKEWRRVKRNLLENMQHLELGVEEERAWEVKHPGFLKSPSIEVKTCQPALHIARLKMPLYDVRESDLIDELKGRKGKESVRFAERIE